MELITLPTFALFWHLSFMFINKYHKNHDISKNINHLIHALLFVLFHKTLTIIMIPYLIDLSIGFYIYDVFFIFYKLLIMKDNYLKHLPYLFHHSIAFFGLVLAKDIQLQTYTLTYYYLLEYSNFMIYISYHIHKRYAEYTNLILVSQCFQYIWYTYFRIGRFIIYTTQISDIILEQHISIYLVLITLFLMGLIWSYNLFLKCFRELSLTRKND
jgi:hypothetical protein